MEPGVEPSHSRPAVLTAGTDDARPPLRRGFCAWCSERKWYDNSRCYENNEWMLPSCPLWFIPLAFKPLLSASTSHPPISIQASSSPGVWRVATWHHPTHTLPRVLPDNSMHPPLGLLQTHNSLRFGFESKAQIFPSFLSLSIPHIQTIPPFFMTEMPNFIIHKLLLREISSFFYLLN